MKIQLESVIPDTKIYQMFRCSLCGKGSSPCTHIIDYLTKHDIQFVNTQPDLRIVSYNGGPDPQQEQRLLQLLQQNIPIIVCERTDPASSHLLSTHTKAHTLNTLHPHIHKFSAVFKNFVLTPRSLYNHPTILSRYHYSVLRQLHPEYHDDHPETPSNTLSPDVYQRVYPVPWHRRSSFLGTSFEPLRTKTIDFAQTRPIDVMCSVSTRFGSYYHFHRQRCRDILRILPCKTELRELDKKRYLEAMKQSKICVSPYGLGEFGYRDYEAIYCGALLIKPDCSHVETWPNIYQHDTYIPCKPDFPLHCSLSYSQSLFGQFSFHPFFIPFPSFT